MKYRSGPRDKIRWTYDDSAKLRMQASMYVIKRRYDKLGDGVAWNLAIVCRNPNDVVDDSEIALRSFRCEKIFNKLQAFVIQQRLHGWAGTWDTRDPTILATEQFMRRDFATQRKRCKKRKPRYKQPRQ